jgi:predicted aldo/keto reductase-like oxidoreductase
MPRRRFGRTELDMPVFSCGGMRYQQAWQDDPPPAIDPANQATLEACIRRSLELGINHIETARGYGTSELQLGRILPTLPREQMIVQTKVGPKPDGAEFRRVFEKSLGLLRLDHVDLLAIHGINNPALLEEVLRPGGSLDMAEQLRREGRCRFIGFSTHGPVDTIVRACATGRFDYVNLHWYFVNEFNWPAVLEARRQDMGVFIISPNDKGGKLYEAPEKVRALCAPLTPMQFNDLYCLARAEVHTLSVGAARPTDFDEHVAGLRHYGEAAALTAPIAARIRTEMERVLGADWVNGWHHGLPEWTDVPGDINLHEILRLWTYAKSLDLVAFGRMRYNLLGQADHWFPGNNAEQAAAVDLGPALRDSPFRDRIPSILQKAHELLFDVPKQRLSKS